MRCLNWEAAGLALPDLDAMRPTLIANLLRAYGEVPEAGVFPYWHRDLNYMTVPYLAGFVAESLEADLALIDRTLAAAPEGDATLLRARAKHFPRCLAVRRIHSIQGLSDPSSDRLGQSRHDALVRMPNQLEH